MPETILHSPSSSVVGAGCEGGRSAAAGWADGSSDALVASPIRLSVSRAQPLPGSAANLVGRLAVVLRQIRQVSPSSS